MKKILTDGFSVKNIVLYCNRGGTKVLWNKMILSEYDLSRNAFTRLKIPSPIVCIQLAFMIMWSIYNIVLFSTVGMSVFADNF